jgi:hypothetical protein
MTSPGSKLRKVKALDCTLTQMRAFRTASMYIINLIKKQLRMEKHATAQVPVAAVRMELQAK